MNERLVRVKEFHESFEHPVNKEQGINKERAQLRFNLLLEEVIELGIAMGIPNYVSERLQEEHFKCNSFIASIDATEEDCYDNKEILDALCDIDYVLNGAVLETGFHDVFEEASKEVHRSNMSKAHLTDISARATADTRNKTYGELCEIIKNKNTGLYLVNRISDGKTIKNINYSPANLKQFIK